MSLKIACIMIRFVYNLANVPKNAWDQVIVHCLHKNLFYLDWLGGEVTNLELEVLKVS